MPHLADSAIEQLEGEHRGGITSAALLTFFAEHQIRFGEATLRKWVQLGLLPRSVRVGQKGKHQGSKGMYPITVVRRIMRIKSLMERDLTIEDIQNRFLFVRDDIEQLEERLQRIFVVLNRMVEERGDQGISARAMGGDLKRAHGIADELLERIKKVEQRLINEAEEGSSEAAAS
jgi:hypothetical protein